MFKIILYIFIFIISLRAEKFNINEATDDQLLSLPLSLEKIEAIKMYLYQYGNLYNIYDLMDIEEISSEDIHTLKSYFTVDIPLKDNRSNYKVGWWLTNEGNTEGLSEVWLDKFFEPQDINTMTRDELSGLPNFSPIDVVAVLKQKERGLIRGTFELKNSPGISYYGYKNLLDFIKFPNDQDSPSKFHFRYSYSKNANELNALFSKSH